MYKIEVHSVDTGYGYDASQGDNTGYGYDASQGDNTGYGYDAFQGDNTGYDYNTSYDYNIGYRDFVPCGFTAVTKLVMHSMESVYNQ